MKAKRYYRGSLGEGSRERLKERINQELKSRWYAKVNQVLNNIKTNS